MKKHLKVIIPLAIVLFLGMSMTNYYNKIVTMKVDVESSWAQVENQYQRRFDLIPNLVNTVKGYAAHEKETFSAIAEARSKAGGVTNIGADVLNNPQAFQKLQAGQAGLGRALQRLMVTVEKYPELKADRGFIRLQDELSGTENRLAQERRRFNNTVAIFNKVIVVFPGSMLAKMFGMQRMEHFKASVNAQEAPQIEF